MINYSEFPTKYFGSKTDFKTEDPAIIRNRQSKFRLNLVNFIDHLPQNARVLDAGCGNGKVTRMILSLRPDIRISAMDISDVSEYIPKLVDFKVGSVEDLSGLYSSEYFDAVISLHVIEHLLFPMRMINSIKFVLKKGGKMFLETPNWVRVYMPFSPNYFWNDYTHVRPFSKYSMNKLLTEFDFKNVKLITTNTMSLISKNSTESCCGVIKKQSEVKKDNNLKTMVGKIILRLTHPLFKDILIVEAEK